MLFVNVKCLRFPYATISLVLKEFVKCMSHVSCILMFDAIGLVTKSFSAA